MSVIDFSDKKNCKSDNGKKNTYSSDVLFMNLKVLDTRQICVLNNFRKMREEFGMRLNKKKAKTVIVKKMKRITVYQSP